MGVKNPSIEMDDKKKIDKEEARVSHRSTSPLTPTDKSPSPSKVQSMFQRGWGALRFSKFVQLNLPFQALLPQLYTVYSSSLSLSL